MSNKRFFSVVTRDKESLESLREECKNTTGAFETGFGVASVDAQYLISREEPKRDGDLWYISGTSGFFRGDIDSMLCRHNANCAVRIEGDDATAYVGVDDGELREVSDTLACKQERKWYSVSDVYDEEKGCYVASFRSDYYMADTVRLGLSPDIHALKGRVEVESSSEYSSFNSTRKAYVNVLDEGSIKEAVVDLPVNSQAALEPYAKCVVNTEYIGGISFMQVKPDPDFGGFETGSNATFFVVDEQPFDVHIGDKTVTMTGEKLIESMEAAQSFGKTRSVEPVVSSVDIDSVYDYDGFGL